MSRRPRPGPAPDDAVARALDTFTTRLAEILVAAHDRDVAEAAERRRRAEAEVRRAEAEDQQRRRKDNK
jgi:hypothetical protein